MDDEPMVVSNPRHSEAFDWVVTSRDAQKRYREVLFETLLPIDPDVAAAVHFDPMTGMLMMPESPDSPPASGETSSWERCRSAAAECASSLADRLVQSFVKDDRYYRFRFNQFSEQDWIRFQRVFAELPGWMNVPPQAGVPRWFGVNESRPPFLWASVEDFGFEVFGIATRKQWIDWHEQFMQRTRTLPALRDQRLMNADD